MASPSRNVLLVTVDSLRADHCGFMGYDRNTTPSLDKIASGGITFTNAISPGPATPQSTPAMFTESYPAVGGASIDGSASGRRERIRQHMKRQRTTAERFSDLGYRTAAFTPNPWTSRYFNFDQGFDHFQDFMDEDRSSSLWERMLEGSGSTPITALRLVASWLQRANTFKPWESFIDEILEWVNDGPKPYFAWVFLMDAHFPYLSGRGHRSQPRWQTYEANLRLYLEDQDSPYDDRVHEQLVTAYDDALRYTDDFFKELMVEVDTEETSLVITADHGEAFGENGTYGHHDKLYKENIHVPLVVSGGPNTTVETPISLRTLPSLLTHLGDDDWESVVEMGHETVGSRTEDDATASIQGKTWKYLETASGGELKLFKDGEERHIKDEGLESLGTQYLSNWRAGLSERDIVVEATADLAAEGAGETSGASE